jgi:electron transfer flavoprotein alpha subunit
MKALVIAQSERASRELCAGAYALGAEEVALVSWQDMPHLDACDTVYTIAVPEGETVEDAASTIITLVSDLVPDLVLAEATRSVQCIVGAVAAAHDTAVITDVLEFDGSSASTMYYGGVALRSLEPKGLPSFYTVAAGAFEPSDAVRSTVRKTLSFIAPCSPVRVVCSAPVISQESSLASADVVVAAGRGFTSEAQLAWAKELCEGLGAGLGCSRPLTETVDWMPRDAYLGVSGRTIKPRIYMGVGISGQMQHMVGVSSAEHIVAINDDRNAPIFTQADLGIVGTLETVLPALLDRL